MTPEEHRLMITLALIVSELNPGRASEIDDALQAILNAEFKEDSPPRHLWNRDVAEKLGEMHTVWSDQFNRSCVVCFPNDSANRIIQHCRAMGATYREYGEPEDTFVVVLRFNVGPELYTAAAIRGSRS